MKKINGLLMFCLAYAIMVGCERDTIEIKEIQLLAQLEEGSNIFPWVRGEELSLYRQLEDDKCQFLGNGVVSTPAHKITITNKLLDKSFADNSFVVSSFYPSSLIFESGKTIVNIKDQSNQDRLNIHSSNFMLDTSNYQNGNTSVVYHNRMVRLHFYFKLSGEVPLSKIIGLTGSLEGFSSVAEMKLNGTVLNKRNIDNIPLKMGHKGSSAQVTIFPNEEFYDKQVKFIMDNKSYLWSVPERIKFNSPGDYYYSVVFSPDSCFVSEVNQDREYIYQIGSEYPNAYENKGIVYELDSSRKHGKAAGYLKKKGCLQYNLLHIQDAMDYNNGLKNTIALGKSPSILMYNLSIHFSQTSKDIKWYIPAINELEQISMSNIFIKDTYWSSTQIDRTDGLVYDFTTQKMRAVEKQILL